MLTVQQFTFKMFTSHIYTYMQNSIPLIQLLHSLLPGWSLISIITPALKW